MVDINRYLKKSGDDKILKAQFIESDTDTFVTYNVTEDKIIILQCYGDGRRWHEFFSDMSKKLDKKVVFATKRNPKAFERKFGCKLIGYVMEF